MGCKDSKQAGAEVDGPSATNDNVSSSGATSGGLGGTSIGSTFLNASVPKIDMGNLDRD